MTASTPVHQPRLETLGEVSEEPTLPSLAPAPQESVAETFGHYAIERLPDGSPWVLGHGGMGITFKAIDTNLRCPVALKIISPTCFGSEHSERRFVREAQLAALIRHPNVAAIHHLDCQNGQFFYAMEFVDGITAEAWVRQRGVMTIDFALDIVMQITRALTAADQLKVLHRDIKPGNIMILPDPANGLRVIAKLIDFGLARSSVGEVSPSATTVGFAGTPQYASPEQAENLPLDVRSDLYSLGSTLWFFLVGHAPFNGTTGRVIAQLLMAEPPWQEIAHLPKCVQQLLRGMLAKSADRRPQTPVALHEQIVACRTQLAARLQPSRRFSLDAVTAVFRPHLRPMAFAGMLSVVLVALALAPRSHPPEQSVLPPPIPPTLAAKPLIPPVTKLPQSTAPLALPSADELTLNDTELALTNFDPGEDLFTLGQIPDPAAALSLNNAAQIDFDLSGPDSEDTALSPTAGNSVASQIQQRVNDRQRKDRRHKSQQFSVSGQFNRMRGAVTGFVRHLF